MDSLHINLEDSQLDNFLQPNMKDFFPEKKIFKYLKNLKIENCTIISFQAVQETYDLHFLFEKIDLLIDLIGKISNCKIVLILNSCKKFDLDIYKINNKINEDIIDIIFIDFFAMKIIHTSKLEGYKYNLKWNPKNNKALFLIGKPLKFHRIGLLYQYYKSEMLNYLEWSFYLPDSFITQAKSFIIENIDDKDFEKFVHSVKRELDEINYRIDKDHSFHYSGLPFDEMLYQNTSLSIISETLLENYNGFLTEKTYRCIANNHPFILVGDVSCLNALKSNGFKTFTEYMKIPNYASIPNTLEKLQSIVSNTKFFLENCEDQSFRTQINLDIQHNFYRLKEYVNENKKLAGKLESKLIYL